jgi:hypothetical protein
MLKSKSFPILAGAAAVGLSLFVVAPANAFVFTSDDCTGHCLTGQANGGTVTVTQVATNELGFTISLANGNQFINAGFDASFGFNLSGISSITYSNISPAGFTIPNSPSDSIQNAGSLHMDGTGFFSFGLEGFGSGGSAPDGSSLSFDITATGLTLANLTGNAAGELFAADIISGTTPAGCTLAAGNCNTGGIDVPVPAPLVGHGLLVLLAIGGVLSGSKLLERHKKDHLQAA